MTTYFDNILTHFEVLDLLAVHPVFSGLGSFHLQQFNISGQYVSLDIPRMVQSFQDIQALSSFGSPKKWYTRPGIIDIPCL